MSERYPLEDEIPSINEVPEDTYNPPKLRRRQRVIQSRTRPQQRTSYSVRAHSLVTTPQPLPSAITDPSLAPAVAKPVPAQPAVVKYDIVRYKMERRTSITLNAGDEEPIISETENGEIVGFMMKVDNINMIAEIAVFGDDNEYDVVNDDSVLDLIEDGAGLSIGDIAQTGTISPDNAGESDSVFPYVKRAKLTTETDVLGISGEIYVVKYTPAIPLPYKAISVAVRNNSTVQGTILKLRLHRRIFTELDSEVGDNI